MGWEGIKRSKLIQQRNISINQKTQIKRNFKYKLCGLLPSTQTHRTTSMVREFVPTRLTLMAPPNPPTNFTLRNVTKYIKKCLNLGKSAQGSTAALPSLQPKTTL